MWARKVQRLVSAAVHMRSWAVISRLKRRRRKRMVAVMEGALSPRRHEEMSHLLVRVEVSRVSVLRHLVYAIVANYATSLAVDAMRRCRRGVHWACGRGWGGRRSAHGRTNDCSCRRERKRRFGSGGSGRFLWQLGGHKRSWRCFKIAHSGAVLISVFMLVRGNSRHLYLERRNHWGFGRVALRGILISNDNSPRRCLCHGLYQRQVGRRGRSSLERLGRR